MKELRSLVKDNEKDINNLAKAMKQLRIFNNAYLKAKIEGVIVEQLVRLTKINNELKDYIKNLKREKKK